MKIFSFLLIQLLLVAVFLLIAYLPTIGMEIFPWGDTRFSEEFKAGLIFLFPISILFIALKSVINKRILSPLYFKYSWVYYLALLLMSSFTLLIAEEDLTYWTVIGICLFAILVLLVEAYFLIIKRASPTNMPSR